jgi:probable rRNA maturation factor
LSFVAGQDQYFKAEPGHQYLGDIMICPPVAKKQAKIYGQAAIIEIERLFVHGLLHLFNYDHQTNQEAKQMEQIETRILEGYD